MVWEGNHGWRKVYLVRHQRSQAYPVMVSLMGRSVGSCLILFMCLVTGEAAVGQQCEQWELEMEQKGARTRSILQGTFAHSVTMSDCSTFQRVMAIASCKPYTSFFQLTATEGEDLGVIEFQLNWVNTMRTITVRFLLLVVWLSGIHSWRHVWSRKR